MWHSHGIIIVIQTKREILCTARFETSMFVMIVTSTESLEAWDVVQNSARTLRVIWLKNERATFLNSLMWNCNSWTGYCFWKHMVPRLCQICCHWVIIAFFLFLCVKWCPSLQEPLLITCYQGLSLILLSTMDFLCECDWVVIDLFSLCNIIWYPICPHFFRTFSVLRLPFHCPKKLDLGCQCLSFFQVKGTWHIWKCRQIFWTALSRRKHL